MTLQQMEYIVAVYRERHFARAAERFGVTQPTLSAAVQKLEDELGVKLFNRTPPITPTPIGLKVIEQAWRTLQRANKIRDIVSEERNSLNGTFRIGILPTISPYLLPRFFPQLLDCHKELDLRVYEMKTDEIKRALAHGDIDAAVLVRLDDITGFNLHTLYYERFLAYVAEDSPLSQREFIRTSDLNSEFLWLLGEGHCFRDQLVKYCGLKAARKSQQTYSLGSIETFMRMVECGKGVTFIPELALSQLSERQLSLVRPFAIPVPVREVVLMTTCSFVRKSILNLLSQAIKASVPPSMLSLDATSQRI